MYSRSWKKVKNISIPRTNQQNKKSDLKEFNPKLNKTHRPYCTCAFHKGKGLKKATMFSNFNLVTFND